jgi:hypothetical protein
LVVTVDIGVKKQVRDVQYKDTAVPKGETRAEVKAVDEILGLVHPAVTVGVTENCQSIRSNWTPRRRCRNLVVNRAGIAIDLGSTKSLGVRILQILHDPQTSPIIPVDRNGLPYQWLCGDQVCSKSFWDHDASERLLGS